MSPESSDRLKLVDVLVVVLVLGVLFTLLVDVKMQYGGRGPARQTQCADHLKNVVLGMHNYSTSNRGKLPGDKNKRSGGEGYEFNARFSMFADILPFVEFESVSDRLNYRSRQPFLKTVGVDPTTGRIRAIEPSATPAKTPGELPPDDAGGWVVGANDPATANRHYEALRATVPIYQCPSDNTLDAAATAINYAPVVTAGVPRGLGGGRFETPNGAIIPAIWPPDDDSVMSGPAPTTLLSPGDEGTTPDFLERLNPVTLDFLTSADGTSNTVGIVERVKGKAVSGLDEPAKNRAAWVAFAAPPGYVVRNGVITADAAAEVERCGRIVGDRSISFSEANDLAGATYLQYTCAWLGCVNLLAPPNTPVCDGGRGPLAQTGLVGPNSFHGGGANVGVMDGTVRFLTNEVDLKVLHALASPAGGEVSPVSE